MGVAEHLKIDVEEYDARIRTFIPDYEELIRTTANVLRLVQAPELTIVDVGIGTGALAAECLGVRQGAELIGIDADRAMLDVARARLAGHAGVRFVEADFLETPLPACDAVVASLALHHVPTPAAKQAFYASCRDALRPGGLLLSADCFLAGDPRVAASQRDAWLAHLMQTYSLEESEGYFAAWASEDVYFTLEEELEWLRGVGLLPEVVWRKGTLAVVAALR